jgi:ribosomal protein S18 acetylase RimI-like enzyme
MAVPRHEEGRPRIIVEDGSASDLTDISSLNVVSYAEFGRALPLEEWKAMEANLSHPERIAERATFVVARAHGKLVGSVAYCRAGHSIDPIPRDWASILVLAVAPESRGQGYGEALVKECLRRGLSDGAEVIGLYTNELMLGAQRIYQRLGFERECEISRRYGLRYFRYRLRLAASSDEVR